MFVDSYEALCRRHIEGFALGAEQYARETQLSKRVNEWTGRLESILADQDSSRPFDIHEYSKEVLLDARSIMVRRGRMAANSMAANSMAANDDHDGHDDHNHDGVASAAAAAADDDDDDPNDSIGEGSNNILQFGDIVEGRQKSDVCRYFLSCLQLANFGNIELISSSPGTRPSPRSRVDGDGLVTALLASTASTASTAAAAAAASHGHFDGSFQFKLLSMDRAKTVM